MFKNKIYIYISIIIVIIFLITMSPIFNITAVNVQGNTKVSTNDIVEQIDLLVLNKNIFTYPANKYEKELTQNPYFSNVTVSKKFPNQIDVTLEEKNISFYVLYSKNTYLYLDNEGVVLDTNQNITESCPIIKGLEFENFTLGEKLVVSNQKAFDDALTISKTIKRYGDFEDQIVVDVSDVNNINIVTGNINIVFGDVSDCDLKVRRCIATIPEIDPTLKGYLYVNDVNKKTYFKIIT